MDSVYFIISNGKTNIFTDSKETSSVYDLKRTVEGILKRKPDEQKLYKGNQELSDGKNLKDCGITNKNAGPEDPTRLCLALQLPGGSFETTKLEPFSSPDPAKP